ncbi:MAG TPA: hypothetical protein VI603_15625 [Saprospiraceae bacterium]|nr:hypothetical protein [Saprospiraceae bacterium]
MSTLELRKKLIDKIQSTEDQDLLEEVYRLLDPDVEDLEIYKLNHDQLDAVVEAKNQIRQGHSLTDEQANKEIDEWLNK